jgi:hypothetical protein
VKSKSHSFGFLCDGLLVCLALSAGKLGSRLQAYAEASLYPRFTMLGQSLGSMLLAAEALVRYPPHVFMDSTGKFHLPSSVHLG